MWIAKLKIRHSDCVVGARCKKFNVISISTPFNKYDDKKYSYFSHFEILNGKEENIKRFIDDLKKDERVTNLEVQGNSLFFLVKIPKNKKIPTTHYDPRTFFIKPLLIDTEGYELWEIGSWKRELINNFISNLKKEKNFEIKILKIEDSKLENVYFPQIMPNLTKNQKKALELAFSEGYYDYPRKADLKELAKIANISLSTFREHLRRAEKKIMPDLIRNVRDEIPQ